MPCTYQQITVNIYADNQNVYGNSQIFVGLLPEVLHLVSLVVVGREIKMILGGYQSTGNLYSNTTYNITCSKGAGSNSYSSDSASVTVSVGSQPIMSGFLKTLLCVIASRK